MFAKKTPNNSDKVTLLTIRQCCHTINTDCTSEQTASIKLKRFGVGVTRIRKYINGVFHKRKTSASQNVRTAMSNTVM